MQKKTRTYDYTPSSLDLEAVMTMSGLDYLKALVAGDIGSKPTMMETLESDPPCELTEGSAAIYAQPQDYALNPMGGVHGGYSAALLDSAMGCAVQTTLPAATGYTTAEIKINYLRPIKAGGEKLKAVGTVIHGGRQMITAEGYIYGVETGKKYAHGTTTCFVFPLKKA